MQVAVKSKITLNGRWSVVDAVPLVIALVYAGAFKVDEALQLKVGMSFMFRCQLKSPLLD